MKTILVPTDFSLKSTKAAQFAANLATYTDSDLLLFHVGEKLASVLDPQTNSDEVKIQQQLQQIRTDKISVKYEISTGNTTKEINKIVTEIKPWLVVLGISEKSIVDKIFNENTSVEVLKTSDYPILSIHEKLNFRPIKNIVIATDYKLKSSEKGLQTLKNLADAFNATITLIHVNAEKKDYNTDTNNYFLPGLNYNHHTIQGNNVKDAIEEYITENQTDLLVMVPGKHNLLERLTRRSNTRSMIFQSKVPLLILPEEINLK